MAENNSETTMLIIDKNHTIESISEDSLACLRRQRDELIGKKCYRVIHGNDNPPSFCPLLSKFNSDRVEDFLSFNRDLLTRECAVRCLPLTDENGAVLKIMGLTDVGSEPSYADLLTESDFQLEGVLNVIPYALLLTNTIGVITVVNSGAVSTFGYTGKDQMRGRSIYEFLSPGDRLNFQEDWQKTLAGSNLERRVFSFIKDDGMQFPGTVFASVLRDYSGMVTGVILGIRNVTIWRELQDSLKFSETVLRSIKEGIVAWNNEYIIVHWNQACQELFGVPPGDAIGKRIDEVVSAVAGYPAEHPEEFLPDAKRGFFSGEVLVRAQQAERWVYAEVYPIDQNGQRQGWVAVATDITEQKKLAQHLNIMDTAVAASIAPIIMADFDGKITYANDAFLKLWGYADRSEIIGRSMGEFWHAADTALQVVQTLRNAGGWEGELTGVKKDASTFDVRLAASTVKNDNGQPVCIMASFIDVTEAKKSREAVAESQTFVSGLLENSHHPILVINQDTTIRYVNPAMEKLTGYNVAELIGKKAPYPWLIQESLPRTVKEFRVAMSYGPKWYEELYRKKNGKHFWVEVTSAPILKDGALNYYMVSWVDITDRRLIEEELTKERDRQKTYLDTVGVMVATVDSHGKVTMVNKKGCETLGYKEKELIGQNWYTLLVPQRLRSEVRKTFRSLLAQVSPNGARHNEGVLVTRSGEEKLFTFTHTLIRVPGKKATQILISAEDTTELRKTQEQLEHSHLLASLGEMTAGIAHEVNNPLGSILLYAELLMASDVPPQTKKDLKIIHDEAKRATKIMTDLLIYGRRTKPQVRRVNLNSLIKKVMEMRRYQHKVQNIKATVQLSDNPLFVKGDGSQLIQVFMNIILNAEDALREHRGGSVIVTSQGKDGWARVTIADDGPGIPQENINRLFFPFFTTKPVGEGTGLGLSICYGIVTAHNGLIHAENNSSGGATFAVELPLASRRTGKTAGNPGDNGNGGKNRGTAINKPEGNMTNSLHK